MSADALVSRLEKCKRTGNGSWIARCPAHEDKNPSLTVRELEDGRVLVHCFAGCSVEAVLGALSLEFDALFPPRPSSDYVPGVRRPFPAADVLAAVSEECWFVAVTACLMAKGIGIEREEEALERLLLANARISEARRLALG